MNRLNDRISALSRRLLASAVTATATVALLGIAVCPAALAQAPAMPSGPVTINIIDVAGDLALTQEAFELYAKKNPNRIAKFTYTKAPAPELPGKLKAMQSAGRSDIDLVLTGVGFLGNAVEQGLLVKLLPDYSAKFPGLMENYQPPPPRCRNWRKGRASRSSSCRQGRWSSTTRRR